MECSKRAVVFIPNGSENPGGSFLGFQKITPNGTYAIYCVDGLKIEEFPRGWLVTVNEFGQEVDKNRQAIAAQPGGQGISFGFNPFFGLFNMDSPILWILLLVAGFFVIKNVVD